MQDLKTWPLTCVALDLRDEAAGAAAAEVAADGGELHGGQLPIHAPGLHDGARRHRRGVPQRQRHVDELHPLPQQLAHGVGDHRVRNHCSKPACGPRGRNDVSVDILVSQQVDHLACLLSGQASPDRSGKSPCPDGLIGAVAIMCPNAVPTAHVHAQLQRPGRTPPHREKTRRDGVGGPPRAPTLSAC